MMKWPWVFLFFLLSLTAFSAEKLEFFYGPDCNKCEKAKAVLINYQQSHPEINIIGMDVFQDKESLKRLQFISLKEKATGQDLPVFYYRSSIKTGFKEPGSLITWLDETQKYQEALGVTKFLGMSFSYEKLGGGVFSLLLGMKDFFLSLWGLTLIVLSVGLSLKHARLESIIGLLSFTIGAIVSSVLWSFPTARVLFEQTVMIDAYICLALLLVSLFMILKKKKKLLSGWGELALFSLGLLIQRFFTLTSSFELLKLQDTLFESGMGQANQVAMGTLYGLVQLLLSVVIVLVIKIFVSKKV